MTDKYIKQYPGNLPDKYIQQQYTDNKQQNVNNIETKFNFQ